jgi:hypothetical protein
MKNKFHQSIQIWLILAISMVFTQIASIQNAPAQQVTATYDVQTNTIKIVNNSQETIIFFSLG